MTIYSGFTHWKWWFSIVMLVYRRVVTVNPGQGPITRWNTSKILRDPPWLPPSVCSKVAVQFHHDPQFHPHEPGLWSRWGLIWLIQEGEIFKFMFGRKPVLRGFGAVQRSLHKCLVEILWGGSLLDVHWAIQQDPCIEILWKPFWNLRFPCIENSWGYPCPRRSGQFLKNLGQFLKILQG